MHKTELSSHLAMCNQSPVMVLVHLTQRFVSVIINPIYSGCGFLVQLSAVQSPAWARVPVPAQSPGLSTLAQPAVQVPAPLSAVQRPAQCAANPSPQCAAQPSPQCAAQPFPQCAVQSLMQPMVQSLV